MVDLRMFIRNGPIRHKPAQPFAQAPQLMTREAWLVPIAGPRPIAHSPCKPSGVEAAHARSPVRARLTWQGQDPHEHAYRRLSGAVWESCLVRWHFCGGDMLPRRLWKVAAVVTRRLAGGVLGPLEAELAGDLVAQGAVFGPEPGDLGSGGVEPLAKRVGAGALRGQRGRWSLLAQLADEVADLVLAVEPWPGDAGCARDSGVVDGFSLALELLDGVPGGGEGRLVAPGVGLGEVGGVVSAVHCLGFRCRVFRGRG